MYLRKLSWPLAGAITAGLIAVSLAGATSQKTNPLLIGQTNTATQQTTLQGSIAGSPLLQLTNSSTAGGLGAGLVVSSAVSGGGSSLFAQATGTGIAIQAESASNVAIIAMSGGDGIISRSSMGGVIGTDCYGGGPCSPSPTGIGVVGANHSSGIGVQGESSSGIGVHGVSQSGDAGRFDGNVTVNGDLSVTGTLTKGAGAFRIDDPLDPANEYLQHSFVESPDMLDIYNGNVTTDGEGFAVVKLPVYFQALNKDFRYQLTIVGHSFARAIVWKEIRDNRFTIRTDQPRVKVSWQVTGIRHDPYANAHRIKVVVPKTK